jgi:hypothetical protein
MLLLEIPDWAFPWEVFGWLTALVTFVVMVFIITQHTPGYTYNLTEQALMGHTCDVCVHPGPRPG